MKNSALRIIPLGGLGEVGRNMVVYEYDDSIIIVDCGTMFPENDMLGIDYIIPDFTYLRGKERKVKGIVITHGHEDHIGAIHHLIQEIPAPIYATPLTMGLIEVKLARKGLVNTVPMRIVNAGDTITLGQFKIDFFHVCHSIPDAVGLGIETPEGLIVQSGDYKFDHTPVDNWPTDYAKLAEFSRRGVLALLSDSTNATRPGWTPSEQIINQGFEQVFTHATGRVIIASFASLVSRMQQVANATIAHERKMAFVGTSMVENARIAQKLGYLKIPEGLVVPLSEALNMPNERVVIMCTGAQGEPTSILGRLSRGEQRQFDIKSGDTVVLSSKVIPGNEEAVFSTINDLFRLGADVIYEEIAPVHVSGHGSQEDIKLLIHLTKPKYFIPAYGEVRHLKQASLLARQTGIPEDHISVIEDGQVVSFKNNKMKLAERVPSAMVFVDGSLVGDIGPEDLKDREMLSRDGIVIVHLNLSGTSGKLFSKPAVASRGFMAAADAERVLQQTIQPIEEVVARSNGNLEGAVVRAVKDVLYRHTHRNPTVIVTVSRV